MSVAATIPQSGAYGMQQSRGESISWETVEEVTRGHLGRVMTTCPLCSEHRRAHNRRSKVLAVNLIEPEFAVYFCNHCGESGFVHPDKPSRPINPIERQCLLDEAMRHAEESKSARMRSALAIWNDAQLFRGSPADDYLRHTRRIGDWLDVFQLDSVFHYHPSCPFGDERLPCLVALVRDIKTDAPAAIHRTALKLGTRVEKIDRKSLGPTGGGAIKISADDEVTNGLLIGEGIETVLSASKTFSFRPAWSVIDKGNLAKFPVLSGVECLTIAIDNDVSGDGQRAAAECINRYVAAGIEVISLRPNLAKDFNDIVTLEQANV